MIISFRIAAAALARPEHHLLDSALRFAAERGVVRKELDDGMLAAETTFAAWAELGSLADTLADPDEHADAESLLAQCDAAVANGDAAVANGNASRPRPPIRHGPAREGGNPTYSHGNDCKPGTLPHRHPPVSSLPRSRRPSKTTPSQCIPPYISWQVVKMERSIQA